MSFNRFRFYDKLQRSVTSLLLGTTVLGSLFISVNVYNNWVEKKRLQNEINFKQLTKDSSQTDSK